MMEKRRKYTTKMVTMACLIALEIILTRFLSINLPFLRLGFGFLPVAVMGMMYGPLWAACGYTIGDVLGMLIFPTGPYFPGFTLTAFLTGLIYGLVLYRKEVTWKRALAAVLVISIGINLCLDTLWLSMLYGEAFWGLLVSRLIKFPFAIVIQTILIPLVWKQVVLRIDKDRAGDAV